MATALRATHPYARPLRGSVAGSGPALTVIEGSRGKPEMLLVRATEIADLIDELTAAGQDMIAMAARLGLAYTNRRLDLIPAIADRLGKLGRMYRDCAKPGAAS